MPALRPTPERLNELRKFKDYFRHWFGGRHWEPKTELRAGLYRGQITSVLRGEDSFSATLLPRLKQLQRSLPVASASHKGGAA